MPETGMDVWVIVGVIAGVVAAAGAWWVRSGGNRTTSKIRVSGSPGANVIGRDRGGAGGPGDTATEIAVDESQKAKVAGRDDREN